MLRAEVMNLEQVGKEAMQKPPHRKGKGAVVLSLRTEWASQRKCKGLIGMVVHAQGDKPW